MSNQRAVFITAAIIVAIAFLYAANLSIGASSNWTPHGPISIAGDSQFTLANGVTNGSGTKDDPYVIEKWAINASSATGIYITNTTAYVTIRNCLIENGGVVWSGIFITNASNITVINNISDSNEEGIIMGNSATHNVIDSNTTFGNDDAGIVANYTSNDLIINNTSYGNTFEGMAIWNSTYDNIINNVCANSQTAQGMTLKSDSYLLISGNSIRNNFRRSEGITADGLNNSTITGNLIENNSVGLFLSNTSGYNLIETNTFSKNGNYGIYIQSGSNGNYIHHNKFLNNNVVPQASDSGSSNNWDGNYWSDWQTPDANNDGIVDNPYSIWGGSLDHYPLVLGSTPTPTYFTLTTSVIGQGTISPAGTTTYPSGTEVTITASSASGWTFDHWVGGASGTQNPLTVVMNSNVSIGAYFVQVSPPPPPPGYYTLTTAVVGHGLVAPSTSQYTYGTIVTVVATPENGWVFENWTGDLSGSQNPATIIMTSNKTVVAYFVQAAPPEPWYYQAYHQVSNWVYKNQNIVFIVGLAALVGTGLAIDKRH